jgi:hypothetical protein
LEEHFLLIPDTTFHPKLAVNIEGRIEINLQPQVKGEFIVLASFM